MKKPNQFLKRAGRVVAGVNVLFNLGTAPKPPDLQMPARAQAMQSQWAKNEKVNVLPSWRNRARELGYQLREPVSGEYRPREEPGARQTTPDSPARSGKAKDSHDKSLSQAPSRGAARRGAARESRVRGGSASGRQAGGSRGRGGNGR